MRAKEPSRHRARTIAMIVIIATVTITIINVPIIPVSYSVKVPVQKTEKYTDYLQVPQQIRVPYQEKESRSVKLLAHEAKVPARNYLYVNVWLDLTGKEGSVIRGSVEETAGYDINFYVFDQKGFDAWRDGKSSRLYVNLGKVRQSTFQFVPDKSDTYYFVMDNGYSILTSKLPKFSASWDYWELVTKERIETRVESRPIERERTITVHEEIQKIEYIGLLQRLLQYRSNL